MRVSLRICLGGIDVENLMAGVACAGETEICEVR